MCCELTELIKLPVYKYMYEADISWLNNKVDAQQYLFSSTQFLYVKSCDIFDKFHLESKEGCCSTRVLGVSRPQVRAVFEGKYASCKSKAELSRHKEAYRRQL
jgi:hypothetical protein